MLIIKNITKNKLSSFIMVVIMCISLVAFSIPFNLLLDSIVTSKESRVIARENKNLQLIFENEIYWDELTNIVRYLNDEGTSVGYSRRIIFKGELFDRNADVLAVTSENLYEYNILSGRNITDDEIDKGEKVAVISEVYRNLCIEINDKMYIEFDEERYEVVGFIGNKNSISHYNLNIVIPYTTVPGNWNLYDKISSYEFHLSNKSDIDIERIKELFKIREYSFSTPSTVKIFSFLFGLGDLVKDCLILFIVAIINIVLFSMFIVYKKRNQIGILKAIGYSNKSVNKIVFLELLFLLWISSVISWIIYYPFARFFEKNFFNVGLRGSIIILLSNIILSLICSVIIMKVNSRRVNKLSISSNIRGSNNIVKKRWLKIIIIMQISIVFIYSVKVFQFVDYVFSTLNRAESIIDIDKIRVTDAFTVSFSEESTSKYKVEETFINIKNNDVGILNYLYSVDTSSDVRYMNNKDKEHYYNANYINYYFDDLIDIIPMIYIEKDSFDYIKIKFDKFQLGKYDVSSENIPVIAGYDYKEGFSIGSIIKGDSGNNYEIIGFLDKNQYMFDNNNGTDSISNTNNLNSFIVIPYDSRNIEKLPLGYDYESFQFYSMSNSMYTYNSYEGDNKTKEILKDKGIATVSGEHQLKIFTTTNFKAVAYELFIGIMILIVTLSGVMGIVLYKIVSEKRDIGIKVSCGYTKINIILKYIWEVGILLLISYLIMILKYSYDIYIKLSLIDYVKTVSLGVAILIVISVFITCILNEFEPRELIGGDRE